MVRRPDPVEKKKQDCREPGGWKYNGWSVSCRCTPSLVLHLAPRVASTHNLRAMALLTSPQDDPVQSANRLAGHCRNTLADNLDSDFFQQSFLPSL